MRRIGVPVAKATVYVFAVAFWAFAMLFTYNLVGMIFRGHIEERGLTLLLIMFGLAVLYGTLSRSLIKFGVPKAVSLFQSTLPANTDAQYSNPPATKDETAMAKNENPSFTFSQPVSINASTNYNTPGGIIGNAPIIIHQHFDKPQPTPPAPDAQTVDAVTVVPEKKDPATLDELQAYTEKRMGKPVAENTVRNILERGKVESCGEEIRGRARAKTYPREQAEKAIDDYINKKK